MCYHMYEKDKNVFKGKPPLRSVYWHFFTIYLRDPKTEDSFKVFIRIYDTIIAFSKKDHIAAFWNFIEKIKSKIFKNKKK